MNKTRPRAILRNSLISLAIACASCTVHADPLLMMMLLDDINTAQQEKKREEALDLAERAPVKVRIQDQPVARLSAKQFSELIDSHRKWFVVMAADSRKLGRLLLRSEDQSVTMLINTPRYGARLKKESVITVGHTGKDNEIDFFYKDVRLHFKQHNLL